jgi:hypothetical protein
MVDLVIKHYLARHVQPKFNSVIYYEPGFVVKGLGNVEELFQSCTGQDQNPSQPSLRISEFTHSPYILVMVSSIA